MILAARPQTRVKFGGHDVRKFSKDSTIRRPFILKSEPMIISTKSIDIERAADGLASRHLVDLRRTLYDIGIEKLWNPVLYLQHGEVTEMTDGSWEFSWNFIHRMVVIKRGGQVRKRGYTVAEVLRRSSRTLDHSQYFNPIVQKMYKMLAPSTRMKTDREWLQRRIAKFRRLRNLG